MALRILQILRISLNKHDLLIVHYYEYAKCGQSSSHLVRRIFAQDHRLSSIASLI